MHEILTTRLFKKITTASLPALSVLSLCFFCAGLYFALFASPPDYQQGETVRMMYVHVPAAWMALSGYVALALFCASGFIWKNPLSAIIASAIAPVGAAFTAITLITGSLWGKPIWGAWWVWDARLTSMLVLLFFYAGYMALRGSFDNPERGAKAASLFALVGLVNIPIVKFSVEWWYTLHQPASVFRAEGPSIHGSMLLPLLLMCAGFACYFAVVTLYRTQSELLARRILRCKMARLA